MGFLGWFCKHCHFSRALRLNCPNFPTLLLPFTVRVHLEVSAIMCTHASKLPVAIRRGWESKQACNLLYAALSMTNILERSNDATFGRLHSLGAYWIAVQG